MNDQQSSALSAFQVHCQEIYICYSLASVGIADQADKISKNDPDRSKRIFVGVGHPSKGNFQGVMNLGKYLDSSARNGEFSSIIAKSFVTTIYSLWDEYYRHLVAEDVGATAKEVKSGLMGDLRKVRHCIVHNKSLVSKELEQLEELKWRLEAGAMLKISDEMFQGLMDQINAIRVKVERLSGRAT
ncbi:MAG: hypothetical protein J0I00_14245 [Burkholderiales bacterium]|nr:hypothetical protein [Burkholderiales bacterium]